jgi:hypothetical protein
MKQKYHVEEKIYFAAPQENAVREIITLLREIEELQKSDSQENVNEVVESKYKIIDELYYKYLQIPLHRMSEALIHTYKLHSFEDDVETTIHDSLSDLYTKFPKFDPNLGKKSYSYFGTIIKRYLIGRRNKEQTKTKREGVDYEIVISELSNNSKYSYELEKKEEPSDKVYSMMLETLSNQTKSPYKNYDLFQQKTLEYMQNPNHLIGGDTKITKTHYQDYIQKELPFLTAAEIKEYTKQLQYLYKNRKNDLLNNK